MHEHISATVIVIIPLLREKTACPVNHRNRTVQYLLFVYFNVNNYISIKEHDIPVIRTSSG